MKQVELARFFQVPVLTTGVFQGSKGPAVEANEMTLDNIIRASNEMRPYLDQALLSGGPIPGNPDALKAIGKPLPAAININHDSLEDDKIRDDLLRVGSTFGKAYIADEETGELKPWIVQNFEGVSPVTADFIRRYFQKRSIELLPLKHPETGEVFSSGAIISTAFLDNATPPAVPGQSPNLFVEFAAAESPLVTITTQQPIMEDCIMPENIQKDPVDVAELQKVQATLAELQAKVETAEAERNKTAELARKIQEEKDAKITELQARLDKSDSDRVVSELKNRNINVNGKVHQLSPAFISSVEPLISGGGVIELAEGENAKDKTSALVENLIELCAGGKVLVPMEVEGSKDYKKVGEEEKPMQQQVTEMAAAENISENEAWIKINEKRFKEVG